MRDEFQVHEQNNLSATINAFTQGLRELPTDTALRVKNFLTEYLGSRGQPVPFGGRDHDFKQLNNWLEDTHSTPYILLAAPAGRGKSALLLRWSQQLLARRDLAIVYFPVSIRFRTNLASETFPALVVLLATLHKEEIPHDPNISVEVWRSLFIDYLTRPLPDSRRLLLVLDGIDEAADWTAGPHLFPTDPPSGLRIVLSARSLVNDPGPTAWLERLGWTQQHLAHTLELSPLDRTGIASVLLQMGFPLELLSSRIDIIAEVYRLSEGDPLLVRLYVEDLWKRGEAVVRLQAEDLHTIQPGLAGYFERWWKEQRLLWGEDAIPKEAALQSILNVLAGALGPLSKKDMLNLVQDTAELREEDFAEHLTLLARFVTGDGISQGYVFSHPRLGNYFYEERLNATERQEIERRFLVWGERTLTALNEEQLAPEQASPYIIQYYGAHLERAQADTESLLALVSNGWRKAWEKLDRALAGFLSDIERARHAAERADSDAISNAHATVPYLGAEICCLLSQTSINSMTSNISPKLMLEAVKTGVWTPAQGLASLRLIPDQVPRARELVALAPYVQEPQRTDILHEALDIISTPKDEYARLDALVELAPGLSEELLREILAMLPDIEDEADRAGVLTELAPALAPYPALIERAIELVEALEEEEYQALALEGMVGSLTNEQQSRVLQSTQSMQNERYRTQVLNALVPYLPTDVLGELLQITDTLQDGLSRMRLLTELVLYLPEQHRAKAMQEALQLEKETEDRDYRIEIRLKLAPFLPETEIQHTLDEIQLHWDENERAHALCALLPYVQDELLPQFQQIVLALKSEELRSETLIQLMPRLSTELLEQIIESMPAIWDEGCKVRLLAELASQPLPKDVLKRLLEMTATIEDPGYGVWLLAELETQLHDRLKDITSNISTVFQSMWKREERLQTFLAIAPRLSDRAIATLFEIMLPEIFDNFTWNMREEKQQADILSKLGPRLPEQWLPTALTSIQKMSNEGHQAQVLVALAPRVQEGLRTQVLDIIRSMKERAKRSQVLEALVSSLPEEHKSERIQEMLQILQIIKDETERTQLVCRAPSPSGILPPTEERIFLTALQNMRDSSNQVTMLIAIIPYLSAETISNALHGVQELSNAEERAKVLEALAPYIQQEDLPYFLQITQEQLNKGWRIQVLKAKVATVPQETILDLFDTALNMENNVQRAEMLEVLTPYIPSSTFPRFWDTIQHIPDERMRVSLMSVVAIYMPEDFFPQFWQALMNLQDEQGQTWVLRALANSRAETFFVHIWDAVKAIRSVELRTSMQKILVRNVPERFFSLVWDVIPTLFEQKHYWSIVPVLASRAPAEYFARFFNIVQTIPFEETRMQIMTILFSRMPETYVLPVWNMLRDIQNKKRQATYLAALAPHLPQKFIPAAWDMVISMKNDELNIETLKALLPYLSAENYAVALNRVQALPHGEQRLEFTEALLPYLTQEQCLEIVATLPLFQPDIVLATDPELATLADWNKRWQMQTLALLAPYLPRDRFLPSAPIALKRLRELSEDVQTWILQRMTQYLPEDLLTETFEIIWSMADSSYRTQALQALVSYLSADGWLKVLELVQAKMHTTRNPQITVEFLSVAKDKVKQSTPAQLYPILHETLHLMVQQTRRDTLVALTSLLPTIHIVGGKQAVQQTCNATLEIGCWWP